MPPQLLSGRGQLPVSFLLGLLQGVVEGLEVEQLRLNLRPPLGRDCVLLLRGVQLRPAQRKVGRLRRPNLLCMPFCPLPSLKTTQPVPLQGLRPVNCLHEER